MPPKKGQAKKKNEEPEVVADEPEETVAMSSKSKAVKKEATPAKSGKKSSTKKAEVTEDQLNEGIIAAITALKSKSSKAKIREHLHGEKINVDDSRVDEALQQLEKDGKIINAKSYFKLGAGGSGSPAKIEEETKKPEESGKKSAGKGGKTAAANKNASVTGKPSKPVTTDDWIGIDFAPPKMEPYREPPAKAGKGSKGKD